MNKTYCLAGVLSLLLATSASAQEFGWSAELGANLAHSGGTSEPTANGAVELTFGGAFVGAEFETLYQDPTDNAEFTLSLGYGAELAPDVALTGTYARTYLDNSGFDSHEVGLALDFPIMDRTSGTFEVVRDLTARATDVSFGAEFEANDRFTYSALVGHDGADVYGEAGVSYAFNEMTSASFLIEVAEGAKPTINLGLTIALGS
ncbi:hypothetical protein [Pararhodobacter oceanensis]|uniref:hypothetical protein n=1 Tax=Pararhodobacter oceanensis TaxID=2172121 RepID=UPI003A9130D6